MEDVHPGCGGRGSTSRRTSRIVGWLVPEGDDANSRDLRRDDVGSTLDEAP